jgi:hypothetical protein
MSDKIVNFADRLKQRQAQASVIPPARPSSTNGGDTTALRDLMVNMFGKTQTEGEDPSASLLMVGMGLQMSLDAMQAPQNATKTYEAKVLADKYSDEQLLDLMRNATEQVIRMKPHFFQGLVASALERAHGGERDRVPKE